MAFKKSIFLIPTELWQNTYHTFLTAYHISVIKSIQHFVYESEKPKNKLLFTELKIDDKSIEMVAISEKKTWLSWLENKEIQTIGVLSDAGVPSVADPGFMLIEKAHQLQAKVVLLNGPSSVFSAIAKSGLDGNKFRMHGYLNKHPQDLKAEILQLEKWGRFEMQIFIETPYRSQQVFDSLLTNLNHTTKLHISADVDSPDEISLTQSVYQWKQNAPTLKGKMCVFIISS